MSTTLKKRPVIVKKPIVPMLIPIPTTLGQEVDYLVEEWYKALGQQVPEEERNLAHIIDKQQEDEWKELMNHSKLAAGEVVLDEQGNAKAPIASGQKPEFGTPEFWAWAKRRKAEKDAERAAQGLAPLPTKKEKEAAKVAKAAEKEAKAKEKEAKAKEKEAKAKAKATKATKKSD
jgi:hypothetical protein